MLWQIKTSLLQILLNASLFLVSGSGSCEDCIGVLINTLPGADPKVGLQLVDGLNARQLPAEAVAVENLGAFLSSGKMLVLTDCGILPVKDSKNLSDFIKNGGNLVALGGDLYRQPIGFHEGRWVTQAEYEEVRARIPLEQLWEDFSTADIAKWTRSSNNPSHPSRYEFVMDATHGRCLHAMVKDLDGWDTFTSPPLLTTLQPAQKYVCFWAKGGPKTNRLLMECEEKDGSRWIATVALTTEWKRFVVPFNEFRFWESVPARSATSLNLQNVRRFNYGLAQTHTGGLWGDHEYWVAEVGTSEGADFELVGWEVAMSRYEPLYPSYHHYVCSDVGRISVAGNQGMIPSEGFAGKTFSFEEGTVRAVHPRPQSSGYDKGRTHRWIPLLDAFSPSGDFRGTVAALRMTLDGKQKWASFAVQSPAFYQQESVKDLVAATIQAMRNPVFIWEAGASRYTSYPDESPTTGWLLTGTPDQAADMKVHINLIRVSDQVNIWQKQYKAVCGKLTTTNLPKELFQQGVDYLLRTELINREGKVIDSIAHPCHVWTPDASIGQITVSKGDFWLDGKAWYPYGVNYMPSSGIAREEPEPFEMWLGPRGYDPEVIERDLSRIKGMGMNMVSVFLYNDSSRYGNLVDLLRLCEKYGIKVNLSLRPGTPLEFQWDNVRNMIVSNRLAQNHTLFAYDLAWEPHFEGFEDRSKYTSDWNAWINQRYGSREKAFAAWKHTVALWNGMVPVPQSSEWYKKGAWDLMCLDYGDFLNDLLHTHYNRARDLVRSVDANHAVSFRMQYTGDPTYWGPTWIPYDFRGVARAVDILEPEGYGRIGKWDQVKGGVFTVAYGRAVNPELPVFWGEAGLHSWDMSAMDNTPETQNTVALFYEDLHRMFLLSHSNGIAFWWYPGGFRTNENSDYGIINPDGTDRPVTQVIRRLGPQVVNQGPVPAPDEWIDLDMKIRPGGLAGPYDSVKEAYWKATDSGKHVGLRLK